MSLCRRVILLTGILFGASCGQNGPIFTDLRVYESPYRDVDWQNDFLIKSQHHDHVGTNWSRVLAYDAAGYDALSVMDYSGNPSLDFSLTKRLWPPERIGSADELAGLLSISILIPNAEEVGLADHVTSPFLTTYIEAFAGGGAGGQTDGANQITYRGLPELFQAIWALGGMPCLAHSWYRDLAGHAYDIACTEIYSAYAEAMRERGREDFLSVDRNAVLLEQWNSMLDRNQRVIGIAVNDHAGPYLADGAISDGSRDSGKIIVLAKERTFEAYRNAFEQRAVIAVRDNSDRKDMFSMIKGVEVDIESVEIDVTGTVTWVSSHGWIWEGSQLPYDQIPPNSRWVRAEIEVGPSVILFTQAFVIRPVGDIDGDYDVDEYDESLCQDPNAVRDELILQACIARDISDEV